MVLCIWLPQPGPRCGQIQDLIVLGFAVLFTFPFDACGQSDLATSALIQLGVSGFQSLTAIAFS